MGYLMRALGGEEGLLFHDYDFDIEFACQYG